MVIGHSNGGMLAVQHIADHSATPALVLLSVIRAAGTRPRTPAGPG
jgi:alpha-beta hydrolase superfamily lysophospholipase